MESITVREHQDELIRLLTQSFCRELINFGVSKNRLPSIAGMVLDYVMHQNGKPSPGSVEVVSSLDRTKIESSEGDDNIGYESVVIRPLTPDRLPAILDWLNTTDVQRYFSELYPTSDVDLHSRLFMDDSTSYHGILYDGTFVGMIGGEQIDERHRRVEMKKFIGDRHFRGLGIGKTATFLWLHHIFDSLDFHKVFIYSLNTNIRNINLNSHLGFELEGILSEDVLLNGKYRDVARMSLLKSKWLEQFPV